MKTNASAAALDAVFRGKAMGGVARRLLKNGFNVNALRTNDTLRKDEWKEYDTAVIAAAQPRLVGVSDLISRGLVYNVGNGLGKTVLEYEDESDITAASLSMDGVTKGKKDMLDFDLKYLPLPIAHKEFSINARVLAASRTTGTPLDTRNAALASQKVSELVEQILFTGASSYSFSGGTLYGYTDVPSRNTGSLTGPWDDNAMDGIDIVHDVLEMKQQALDDRHYGPFILYVPPAYESKLDDDYKANGDKTIRERILGITAIEDVKVADKLTDGEVVLVQMNVDTARIIDALPLQTVEWDSEGEMLFHFKVMTIMVPQIRADQQGRSGIVHYSEP